MRSRANRRASFLVLALVAIVLGACAVVLSISGQSGATRSTYASVVLGRSVIELTESAIAECVSELPGVLSGPPGTDVRPGFRTKAVAGRVSGADVAGRETFTYEPERTRALIKRENLPCDLATVRVKPLWFLLTPNRGELEIIARCSMKLAQGRVLHRTVHAWHAFTIDQDARTFLLWPSAHRHTVDREGDET